MRSSECGVRNAEFGGASFRNPKSKFLDPVAVVAKKPVLTIVGLPMSRLGDSTSGL